MTDSGASLPSQRVSLVFTGSGLEYFKIWIVNICLTIVTLGVYSAWAKVRRMRYLYGNTRLDNHSFSYLADPVKILKGRIVAVGFLIIYSLSWDFFPDLGFWLLAIGVLLLPFIMVTAMSFNMRNSAYRNIRFVFSRDYHAAYLMFIWPLGITLILTGLGFSWFGSSEIWESMQAADKSGELSKNSMLPSIFMLCLIPVIPYLDFLRVRFIVDKTAYGKLQAKYFSGTWGFYKIYIIATVMFFGLAFGLGLGTAGAVALFGQAVDKSPMFLFVMVTVFYAFAFYVWGYMRAARTNMIFDNTCFGQNKLGSHLASLKVGWLYLSNTIAIILSLGLLIPWAQIRMTKYVAECTTVDITEPDKIIGFNEEERNSLGEEMVDAFDLELGL